MSRISQHMWIASVVVVLVVAAFYVGGTIQCKGMGFPLDDGWIHQTYARNLAQTGRFAYAEDQMSAGSTSPLWTGVLAVGYLLRLSPLLWAYILGGGAWLLTGWFAAALARRLYPNWPGIGVLVGAACLLEWHLAWAAFSGMETVLFAALSILLVERYAAGAHPILLGLVGGILVLARPEGVVLVGLVLMVMVLDQARAGTSFWPLVRSVADLVGGLAVLVMPYALFNQAVSGQAFPNTLYAKQAEYRELLMQPFVVRLWRVVRRPMIGAQVLLLPGFLWQAVRAVRGQEGRGSRFLQLLPAVWWASYVGIYALRMPVDYQYGRYLMPTIPFFLLYGVAGTRRLLCPQSERLGVRLVSRAVPIAIGCLLVAFLIIGGRAYAGDVCMINGEMVDVALWLREHTAPNALIAAHDIGAIGYWSERPILDLAGLVTPEVIPFIRDEAALGAFVRAAGADYVVTFPSWYPHITASDWLRRVYRTECTITRERGGENMAVYEVVE